MEQKSNREPSNPGSSGPEWSRRGFLRVGGGCVAHLLAAGVLPGRLLGALGHGQVIPTIGGRQIRPVTQEAWGTLYRVAEGVYGMVSNPFAEGDAGRFTLCNGGLVAGTEGVLMVEAFATAEGARWMSDQAEALSGLRPTHQVVTHYHRDHTDGLGGAQATPDRPVAILSTAGTRDLIEAGWREADSAGGRPLPEGALPPWGGDHELDLGGVVARIHSRGGHTPSDVTVEVESGGERVVFCGDLVWKDMFPNFVDAQPGRLMDSVRALGSDPGTVFVPGHGELASGSDMERYRSVLEHLEGYARMAAEAGTPAEAAASAYAIPEEFGEWFRFSQRYNQLAVEAWYRELAPDA